MKITILTLFPAVFQLFYTYSIFQKAFAKQLISLEVVDFRQYGLGKWQKVDDTPYGGGAGMVLQVGPIHQALKNHASNDSYKLLLTPTGQKFDQKLANELVAKDHLVLVCGHYEGFDERVNNYVDAQVSLGDFVLSGGELAALCMVDALFRLVPGVINPKSLEHESFSNDLLDFPSYTKPDVYEQKQVPAVLLTGNHLKIANARYGWQLQKTYAHRHDLYQNHINKLKYLVTVFVFYLAIAAAK